MVLVVSMVNTRGYYRTIAMVFMIDLKYHNGWSILKEQPN